MALLSAENQTVLHMVQFIIELEVNQDENVIDTSLHSQHFNGRALVLSFLYVGTKINIKSRTRHLVCPLKELGTLRSWTKE